MAGPQNESPADAGRGHLRASHADRERVIGTLKAAYSYGLVTKDEFDARVSQTFAARTYADLAVITADIPAGLAPAPPPLRPARANASPPERASLRPGQRAIVATAVLTTLLYIAAFVVGSNLAAGLLGLGAGGTALVTLFLAAACAVRAQRDKGSGGQPPPRPAVHGVSSAARPRLSG
jgi:hypothetical protein